LIEQLSLHGRLIDMPELSQPQATPLQADRLRH